MFRGYDISQRAARTDYSLYDFRRVDPVRCVDPGCSGTVLAGLMLHTVRKRADEVPQVRATDLRVLVSMLG